MRKQELVHLHALFEVIRRHLAERDGTRLPAGAFDTYDEHGVGPVAIAERKEAHRAAVDHLLDGLQTTVTAQRPAVETASTPSETGEASPSR